MWSTHHLPSFGSLLDIGDDLLLLSLQLASLSLQLPARREGNTSLTITVNTIIIHLASPPHYIIGGYLIEGINWDQAPGFNLTVLLRALWFCLRISSGDFLFHRSDSGIVASYTDSIQPTKTVVAACGKE